MGRCGWNIMFQVEQHVLSALPMMMNRCFMKGKRMEM